MGKVLDFFVWIGLVQEQQSIFYIGGSDVLPPPLKGQEEQTALEGLERGEEQAKRKLVEHNLRLVAHIAKKYFSQTGDQDDLISIGTIGLIKGVSTFKPDKNIRLATYASKCIENAILTHCTFYIHV